MDKSRTQIAFVKCSQEPGVYGPQARLVEGEVQTLFLPSLKEVKVNSAGLPEGASKPSCAESSLRQEVNSGEWLVVSKTPGVGSERYAGAGNRGGNWNNDATNARVSDRNNAANVNADRNNNNGARCVKTSPDTRIYANY